MATLKGLWMFNDALDVYDYKQTAVVWKVNFTIGENEYLDITISYGDVSFGYRKNGTDYGELVYRDTVGWLSGKKTIDFGTEPQTVSAEFYNWLTANATQPTLINYNTSAPTQLWRGQKATLVCNGKKAVTDIAVAFGADGSITYNRTETQVDAGRTATMVCAEKKMVDDVCVAVANNAHALYNGVRLPTIPPIVYKKHPYAWIRKNATSGYYDLLLSELPFFYKDGVRDGSEKTGKPWYRVEITTAETATAWTNNTSANTFTSWGLETNRTILWSNHDIPNGSASATDIYFYGSDPVPTE